MFYEKANQLRLEQMDAGPPSRSPKGLPSTTASHTGRAQVAIQTAHPPLSLPFLSLRSVHHLLSDLVLLYPTKHYEAKAGPACRCGTCNSRYRSRWDPAREAWLDQVERALEMLCPAH